MSAAASCPHCTQTEPRAFGHVRSLQSAQVHSGALRPFGPQTLHTGPYVSPFRPDTGQELPQAHIGAIVTRMHRRFKPV